jgi:hypothetical protein
MAPPLSGAATAATAATAADTQTRTHVRASARMYKCGEDFRLLGSRTPACRPCPPRPAPPGCAPGTMASCGGGLSEVPALTPGGGGDGGASGSGGGTSANDTGGGCVAGPAAAAAQEAVGPLPRPKGCRKLTAYELDKDGKIGEGTFGCVATLRRGVVAPRCPGVCPTTGVGLVAGRSNVALLGAAPARAHDPSPTRSPTTALYVKQRTRRRALGWP